MDASTPASLDFVRRHPAWFENLGVDVETLESKVEPRANVTAFATALEAEHVSGATEPWVQDLIVALFTSLQRPNAVVMEFGGFQGHTSVRLAQALTDLGGGELTVVEWDAEAPERADLTQQRLEQFAALGVTWNVRREDALSVIRSLPDESVDFAYLDDDHSKPHVTEEIRLLWPKMRTGGLICGHDVHGSCDLQTVFLQYGGIALDLPRLGPAGGLGIIQVR